MTFTDSFKLFKKLEIVRISPPLVHSCQILTSVRAGHGGDKKHVSHITSVRDFYEGPRISQNIVELLLIRSINCFRGKVSGDQDTHQRAQASGNFNPLFSLQKIADQ